MKALQARYDSRQSFYGKAMIEEKETKGEHGAAKVLNLYSYGTLVAKIGVFEIDNTKKKSYVYFGNYSQTTTRHQKEFFRQNGLNDKEIKELFKNGSLEKEF